MFVSCKLKPFITFAELVILVKLPPWSKLWTTGNPREETDEACYLIVTLDRAWLYTNKVIEKEMGKNRRGEVPCAHVSGHV